MANDFWSRALGAPAAPRVPQAPSAPAYPGYPPQGAPQPAPAPYGGFQNQHGYAIDVPAQQEEDQRTAASILTEGYLQKPPKWIQQQANDRCPECDSANYAQQSGSGASGQYGGTIRVGGVDSRVSEFVYKRCFNCGYATTHGTLNENQGLHGTGPVVRGARQTDRGGAVSRHVGIIPV